VKDCFCLDEGPESDEHWLMIHIEVFAHRTRAIYTLVKYRLQRLAASLEIITSQLTTMNRGMEVRYSSRTTGTQISRQLLGVQAQQQHRLLQLRPR